MKLIHPKIKDIVTWNTLAIMGGLAFGNNGYVYTTLALFLIYISIAVVFGVKESNQSKWRNFTNTLVIGSFALFNFQFFGPIGLDLTVQATINMYLMFFAFFPLVRLARAKHTNYSHNNKGENHE